MRYIADNGVTACEGLAGDELLMNYYAAKKPVCQPTLRLYTYRSHCALVGRFQNIDAELDLDACRTLDIPFTRRPTGGGAILMGESQLGLCLTTSASDWNEVRTLDLYRRLSTPVIRALDKLGIPATFRPKNDLEVHGRKIAGLGLYFDPFGAMLFHTSLLVDLDVRLMLRVLKIPLEKISDKHHVTSIEQRITTICSETGRSVCPDEVRELVRESFAEIYGVSMLECGWSQAEKEQTAVLAQQKYLRDDWVFQRTPQPEQTGIGVRKTPAGLIRAYVGLKGEVIRNVLITGDFFEASETLNRIEAQLRWSHLDRDCITRAVRQAFERDGSRKDLSADDVVEAVWKAGLNARAKNRITHKGSCYYPKREKDYAAL